MRKGKRLIGFRRRHGVNVIRESLLENPLTLSSPPRVSLALRVSV